MMKQFLDRHFISLGEKSYDRIEAEAMALQLAAREQSHAWIEDGPRLYRCLNT